MFKTTEYDRFIFGTYYFLIERIRLKLLKPFINGVRYNGEMMEVNLN
jgi:hypothetical protein